MFKNTTDNITNKLLFTGSLAFALLFSINTPVYADSDKTKTLDDVYIKIFNNQAEVMVRYEEDGSDIKKILKYKEVDESKIYSNLAEDLSFDESDIEKNSHVRYYGDAKKMIKDKITINNDGYTETEIESDSNDDDNMVDKKEYIKKHGCKLVKSRVMNKERDEEMSEKMKIKVERCKKFKTEMREKHDEKYNEKHDRDKQMDRDRLNKIKDFGNTTDRAELQKQLQELLLILVQLLQQQMALSATTS